MRPWRAQWEGGYLAVACGGGEAVMIAAAAGRSREALAPVWDLPRVTDEHGAYGDKDR